MISNLIGVLADDDGATLVEYGVILLLIAVASMAVLKAFGPKVAGLFAPVVPSL